MTNKETVSLTKAVANETQRQRVTRETRIPVSGPRDLLTISGMDENYAYRWVKDVPGRIQRFIDAGWEYVVHPAQVGQKTVDSPSNKESTLTRNTDGTVLVAMRIPAEWYKEDQEAKQRELDAQEEAMRSEGGNLQGIGEKPDTNVFSVSKPKK